MRDAPQKPPLTAREWYELAVEKGHRQAAAAWWQEAIARGEVNGDGRMRAAGE
jgi:hypothetical protein